MVGGKKKKSKKEKKRHRSSSSSSDSSPERKKTAFDRRLEDERRARKLESKADKARMKEEETAEEKRQRRQAKRMKKDQKRADNASMIPDSIDYTNTNNPFNDLNLSSTFVWSKKLEAEGKSHLKQKDIERENKERIRANLREAEELKRNREARLAAREDMEVMQRDADRRYHTEWERKEIEFSMQQAKARSRLRIEQNRAKAVDYLARLVCFVYINYGDSEEGDEEDDDKKKADDDDFELEEPTAYLKGLGEDDFEDLISDIKVYISITGTKYRQWWQDVMEDGRSTSVTPAIHAQIKGMFKGKSTTELEGLETQVRRKVEAGSGDASFWGTVQDQLRMHMARKRLRESHDEKMKEKLRRIRAEQMKEMASGDVKDVKPVPSAAPRKPDPKPASASTITIGGGPRPKKGKTTIEWLEAEELDEQERENRWRDLGEEETERITRLLYESGSYEPIYGREDDAMPGIIILEEDADDENLSSLRASKRKTPAGVGEVAGGSNATEDMRKVALAGMEANEGIFSQEVQLEETKALWSDKYRPRKPRYLNRVQTGFDWNKYNQTHYDQDNPPPKIVQGYKFNIFYQDLLDRTVAPTFKVLPCEDPEFAEIRFKAGPPYEDIAFKIVNREWEVNYKFGYKCQFANGVFQLWFTFKRYRYRR